ncbi:restriction endonuclease subunit S [Psychromonas sp. MME2]|uniref:restriction endonuclease subunit S n=1 Tax=unclassified Psychromonas TaxID=2614957 RepID=UPI00339CBDE1
MQIENLITEHIETWTSAVKKKNATGRGSSKKIELYGIKKLRELILELAVRGKLVPQDASEEPASVLLDRIAEERALLIKNKTIKKPKTLGDISIKELPFVLPLGWQWAHNIELFTLTKGKKPKELSDTLSKFPYLDIEALDRHNIRKYTNDEKCPMSKENDLLVVCDGSRSGLILNGKIGVIGSTIARIDTYKSVKNYIQLYFKQAFTRLNSSMKGAAIPHLDTKQLREDFLALPPLNEQHRIVAKVDELMLLCDQLEQQTESSIDAHKTLVEVLLNTLTDAKDATELQTNWARVSAFFDTLFTTEHSIDQLKQTILQLAVMGKLVPQDPSDEPVSELIDKIYKEQFSRKLNSKEKLAVENEYEYARNTIINNRVLVKARFICDFITKGTTPSKPELLDDGAVPFLKVYNIVKNTLDFAYKPIFISKDTHTGKLNRSRVFPGDVIMNIVGPPLGKVAIISNEYPEWNMNQALAVFRPLAGINSQYLYFILPTDSILSSVLNEVKGTAGQDNLSLEQCRDLQIPIPSINEQNRIVSKVKELMAICDQLKSQLNQAQQTQLNLTDAIIDKAV